MKLRLTLLLTLMVPALFAGHHKNNKIDKDFDQTDDNSTADVIVQYKQAPTGAHHQKVTQRGGQFKRDLGLIKAGHYSLPLNQLDDMADDPDVAAIYPDRAVNSTLDVATAAINASAAANYRVGTGALDGSGVGIAFVDSGIGHHNDLDNRIVYWQDFTGGAPGGDGHGTHVAMIAAGSGYMSSGPGSTRTFVGVAPGANVISLRVLDANGMGSDSAVISAIQTAISLKNTYNIRVLNLSVGRGFSASYVNDPLCQAVEQAWNAGITVVVAAGNFGRLQTLGATSGPNGYGTITAPGNDPYVITVGAMNTRGTKPIGDDVLTTYSSKGPTLIDHVVKPDLVAPGNLIVSGIMGTASTLYSISTTHIPLNYYKKGGAGTSLDYFRLSGTSMAAPFVSGTVALLLQQNPSMTPDQVKARLMKTAYKSFPTSSVITDHTTHTTYTEQYDVFSVGAGYLDVQAALANNDVASGTAKSPTATIHVTTGAVSIVYPNGTVWAPTSSGAPTSFGALPSLPAAT